MSEPTRTRTTEELHALVVEASVRFADADADTVVAWAVETFGRRLAVACSMAGDTVLPALVSRHLPGVDVLFLDTGYHFAETLGTRDALAASWPITIVDLLPEQTVQEQDATHGVRLYERDASECCRLRKVLPLARGLANYEAWVTGVRREDNALRANAGLVEWDETHQMVKINPLAAWSFEELLGWASDHGVAVNLLLTDGYPSIGCEPCTRRVNPGDDPRSGRWAGLAKTECGIHL
jgi:phosphoadenosine phosphosulfate reductase